MKLKLIAAIFLSALLAACAAGPKAHNPEYVQTVSGGGEKVVGIAGQPVQSLNGR